MSVGYYELLGREFPKDALAEYESNILSIEQMRDIFQKRKDDWGFHAMYDIDLRLDEQTNLYYTNHDFRYCDDLLVNHLLAEQLFAQYKQVDWKRVTNCYDDRIMEKIDELLTTPLVWFPTEDLGEKCVVVGKVAKEEYPPEEFSFKDCRMYFFGELREQAILWFADTLPTKKDLYFPDTYKDLPEDMPLWDRLLVKGRHRLRETMDFIVEQRGEAKAVQIIELFRADWQDILTLELFNTNRLSAYDIERMRKALFEEIERYLRSWKIKAGITDTPKPQDAQKPTEMHFHFNDQIGTMVASADNVNIK